MSPQAIWVGLEQGFFQQEKNDLKRKGGKDFDRKEGGNKKGAYEVSEEGGGGEATATFHREETTTKVNQEVGD